jgi:hypothetical protein
MTKLWRIFISMGVWQGLVMDSLKFLQGRHALLFYALRAACGYLLSLWTSHAVHLTPGKKKGTTLKLRHTTISKWLELKYRDWAHFIYRFKFLFRPHTFLKIWLRENFTADS